MDPVKAFGHVGRFRKFNLKCTCGMCKRERYKRSLDRRETRQWIDEWAMP